MKQKKTEKVISLLRGCDYVGALSIAKTFRLGFTKEQRRTLQIASEVLGGNASFYRQLGIDTEKMVTDAKKLLNDTYLGYQK